MNMTSNYNRGELDFDLNEFDASSISLFPEPSSNCAGTITDGLYGNFSSLPLSADSETGAFFDYSAITTATDDPLDWMSSPALSNSSSPAPWTTSPTFSNDLNLHDANCPNDNAPSPITLTDDTWSTTAQKHNFPENDDTFACEEADSPPPAKKACTKKPSTKSSTASQGRTRADSRPTSKTPRKPKSRKDSSTRIPDSPATPAAPSSPDNDDVASTGDRKARHNHNVIEKQYRSRLNAQFERLLAVLPESQRTRDGRAGLRGSAVSDGEDKRMSKAEVLELARRRIYALEQERRDLQEERSRILESVGIVRQAVQQQWVGGVN